MATLPWAQQQGENSLWYTRFLAYVALGPTRSVSLVATGRRNAYPVPAHWPMQAKQLRWKERASAFDEAAKANPQVLNDFNALLGAAQADSPEPTRLQGLEYRLPPPDEEYDALDALGQ